MRVYYTGRAVLCLPKFCSGAVQRVISLAVAALFVAAGFVAPREAEVEPHSSRFPLIVDACARQLPAAFTTEISKQRESSTGRENGFATPPTAAWTCSLATCVSDPLWLAGSRASAAPVSIKLGRSPPSKA